MLLLGAGKDLALAPLTTSGIAGASSAGVIEAEWELLRPAAHTGHDWHPAWS